MNDPMTVFFIVVGAAILAIGVAFLGLKLFGSQKFGSDKDEAGRTVVSEEIKDEARKLRERAEFLQGGSDEIAKRARKLELMLEVKERRARQREDGI